MNLPNEIAIRDEIILKLQTENDELSRRLRSHGIDPSKPDLKHELLGVIPKPFDSFAFEKKQKENFPF